VANRIHSEVKRFADTFAQKLRQKLDAADLDVPVTAVPLKESLRGWLAKIQISIIGLTESVIDGSHPKQFVFR
jgi:hypothetical protein